MTVFRPLTGQVFIKPEAAPTQTASGLHLAEDWKPEQAGTVIAVGRKAHPRGEDVDTVVDHLAYYIAQGIPGAAVMVEAANLLRELVAVQPEVSVGEYVIFSWQSGQEVFVNDGEERYLVMHEADILAVVDGVAP